MDNGDEAANEDPDRSDVDTYYHLSLAERRLMWRNSPEFTESRAIVRKILIAAAALGITVGGVSGLLIPLSEPQPKPVDWIFGPLVGILVGILVAEYLASAVAVAIRNRFRRNFRDGLMLGVAQSQLQRADERVAEGATDFGSLWEATQKRLDYYHQIATSQARRSFIYGQVAAGLGFVVVLISAILATLADSTASAVSAGITGISGGGLGAFIGTTFMRSQEAASQQLRDYFAQPLEFSRMLAAERLLDKLSGQDKAEATVAIIRSMTGEVSAATPQNKARPRTGPKKPRNQDQAPERTSAEQ
ncbi:hypothetical protein ACIB24_02490 [Spongisporangium articulatum]|uniref:Cyanobacterial TRADD-N associated 2 transmembrane domain-containing protein n=1 Tax=Spongisporangium articulatum TaxID=3362603 RepID=A0ABW8AHT9_9ACTN